MAKCQGPGCTKDAIPKLNNKFCSDKCRLKKDAAVKLEKAKELEKKKLEERKEEQAEMARVAKKKEEDAAARKKKIDELAVQWNQKVKAVAKEVRDLRAKHPDVAGINAGNNSVGDTDGGTNNPLVLALPSDAKGIAKADVFAKMDGFDGSDSGTVKIRVNDPKGNILVHVK